MTRTAKMPAHPPLCVCLGRIAGFPVKFPSARTGGEKARVGAGPSIAWSKITPWPKRLA